MATTFEKTWAFDPNRAYVPATALDLTRWTMWYLAAALTGKIGGLTLGLWTPYASSDSVTAGTDATDRWLLNGPYDGTKIVRGAGAAIHSWIVLKSPVMNGFNWYVTLSFNSAADTSIRLSYSKTAPTGGSITVSPTSSTDQWWPGAGSAGDSQINAGTVDSSRFSLGLTSAGDWYLLGCKQAAGVPNLCCQFHAFSNKKSADLFPVWTAIEYVAGGVCRITGAVAALFTSTSTGTVSRHPTNLVGASQSNTIATISFSLGSTWQPVAADLIDASYSDFPCWILMSPISTPTSIRGRIADLAVSQNTTASLPESAVSPTIGPVDSCRAGNLWFPANVAFNFT